MTVQSLKQSLHQLIDNIDDPELLAAYYKIISNGASPDWWEKLEEETKQSIQQGLEQLDRGESFSHEQVMQEVNELLGGSI